MIRNFGDFFYTDNSVPSNLPFTDIKEMSGDREVGITVLTQGGCKYFYNAGLFHSYSIVTEYSTIRFESIKEVYMVNSDDILIICLDGSSITIQEYSFYMYNLLG